MFLPTHPVRSVTGKEKRLRHARVRMVDETLPADAHWNSELAVRHVGFNGFCAVVSFDLPVRRYRWTEFLSSRALDKANLRRIFFFGP
jgi:hypothetical protein